jgi:alpha-D-ribose 1-methylphosphonate 5-phosphate C-P lyase
MALTSDQKMLIILDELKKTLYIDPGTHGDPTATSDIKTWFKRVDDADTATNAPIRRVDLFYINIRHRIPGDYPLSPQDLVDGDFATPQELLDRIES